MSRTSKSLRVRTSRLSWFYALLIFLHAWTVCGQTEVVQSIPLSVGSNLVSFQIGGAITKFLRSITCREIWDLTSKAWSNHLRL
jgi:hypothetical protein